MTTPRAFNMLSRTGAALLFLNLSAAAIPAIAGSSSAQMQVSVRVIARTILTVDRQPTIVEVSANDVARGYLDVPKAIAFRIRSNAANGYVLQFTPVDAPFSRAEITWNGIVLVIGAEPAHVSQQYQPGTTSDLLTVRLHLAPTAVPGTYPWPIHLTGASL